MTTQEVIEQLDWSLLDEQRQILSDMMRGNQGLTEEQLSCIEGVLNFLDVLSDAYDERRIGYGR